jgi:hypothetical protein
MEEDDTDIEMKVQEFLHRQSTRRFELQQFKAINIPNQEIDDAELLMSFVAKIKNLENKVQDLQYRVLKLENQDWDLL